MVKLLVSCSDVVTRWNCLDISKTCLYIPLRVHAHLYVSPSYCHGFRLPFQCWGYFRPKHKNANYFENHQNPVMLVFIGKLLMSTLRWVPICQGFGHFSGFLHHFLLPQVATSSLRGKGSFWFSSDKYVYLYLKSFFDLMLSENAHTGIVWPTLGHYRHDCGSTWGEGTFICPQGIVNMNTNAKLEKMLWENINHNIIINSPLNFFWKLVLN